MVMVPAPSTPPRARDVSAQDEPLPSFDTSPAERPSAPSPRALPSTIPPPPRTGSFLRAQSTRNTEESRASAWASAPSWVARGGERIRALLPLGMRHRVQGYPGGKVLAASAALGLAFFGIFAAAGGGVYQMLRAPEPTSAQLVVPAPAEEAVPAASSSKVSIAPTQAAQAPGAAADEASVLLDLCDSFLAEHRDADVPAIIARLIARQPTLKDDARVKRVLLSAAGSEDRKASSEAHTLLTGAMGETGASLVYELSVDRDVRDAARARSRTWTTTKDFERVASLPVYAAAKLRNAKTCEDKHALLEFAASVGGSYVRSYLHELEGQTSCKPEDLVHCQPCLRNDSRLADAIAKLDRAAR
jgi:hypothetical protein